MKRSAFFLIICLISYLMAPASYAASRNAGSKLKPGKAPASFTIQSSRGQIKKSQSQNKPASRSSEITNSKVQSLVKKVKSSKRNSREFKRYQKELARRYGLQVVRKQGKEYLSRTGELIVLRLSAQGTQWLTDNGFTLRTQSYGKNTDTSITVYDTARLKDLTSAIETLMALDSSAVIEINSVYELSGTTAQVDTTIVGSPSQPVADYRIGMIDTGVIEPQQLSGQLVQENFGRGATVLPRVHGTVIYNIINLHNISTTYVADAFSGPYGYADVLGIVQALNWLSELNIPVINMSLTGPDNALLRSTIEKLTQQGHIIVAAVGNNANGDDELSRYPSAYDSVVGVTAIDIDYQVYPNANQGSYVDMSALGVGITQTINGEVSVSDGTSYATPFVSAALAQAHLSLTDDSVSVVKDVMHNNSIDLGAPGPDTIYGHGLINNPVMQALIEKARSIQSPDNY
jgi:hypothetical protein